MKDCSINTNHGGYDNHGRGLSIEQGGKAILSNCIVQNNSSQGISSSFGAEINIYGDKSVVKDNKGPGLIVNGGHIRIHLPASHKTSYNNKPGMNRVVTNCGGSITNETKNCATCEAIEDLDNKLFRCQCAGTWYCNRACQAAHWKEHKKVCKKRM